jgi:hypothetical protein
VYGAVKDSVVYLDDTKLNANIPIHEFGHLWCDFIERHNPDLWGKNQRISTGNPVLQKLA